MDEELRTTQPNEGMEAAPAEAPPAADIVAEEGIEAPGQEEEGTPETRKEPPPPPPSGGLEGLPQMLIPLAIFFIIMYVLLIRPQKKKEQQRQEMLGQLKKDDKVVTIGGIIGVIVSINDREVVLRLEDGQKMRMTRSAVSRPVGQEEPR